MPLAKDEMKDILLDLSKQHLPKAKAPLQEFLTAAGDLAAIKDLPDGGAKYNLADEAQALDAAAAIYALNVKRLEKAYAMPVSEYIAKGQLQEADVFRLTMEYGAKGARTKLKAKLLPPQTLTSITPQMAENLAPQIYTLQTQTPAQELTTQTKQSAQTGLAPEIALSQNPTAPVLESAPQQEASQTPEISSQQAPIEDAQKEQLVIENIPTLAAKVQTNTTPNPAADLINNKLTQPTQTSTIATSTTQPPRLPQLGYTNFDLNNVFAADFTALPQHNGVNAHETPTSNVLMARSQFDAQAKPQNPDLIGLYNLYGQNTHTQIQAKASNLPAARIYHAHKIGQPTSLINTIGADVGGAKLSPTDETTPAQYAGYASIVAHHHAPQYSIGLGTTTRFASLQTMENAQVQARIDLGVNTQSRTHRLRVVSDIGLNSSQTLATLCSNFSNNLGYQNTSYYFNTTDGTKPSHALYHYINLTPPQLNQDMSAPRNHVTFSGALTSQGENYSNFAEVGMHTLLGQKGKTAIGGFASISNSGVRGATSPDPATPAIPASTQTTHAFGADLRLYDKTARKWSLETRLGLQSAQNKTYQPYANIALMRRL